MRVELATASERRSKSLAEAYSEVEQEIVELVGEKEQLGVARDEQLAGLEESRAMVDARLQAMAGACAGAAAAGQEVCCSPFCVEARCLRLSPRRLSVLRSLGSTQVSTNLQELQRRHGGTSWMSCAAQRPTCTCMRLVVRFGHSSLNCSARS